MDFPEFDNLDFNIDDIELKYIEVEINGLVKKSQSKNRKMFNITSERNQLNYLMNELPKKDECFKFLSVQGGFSSIAFIKLVSDIEKIEDLFVSSLVVGKKHIIELDKMYKNNKLNNCNFVVGTIFKQSNSKDYGYFDIFKKICNKNNWNYKQVNNHSKIILMKTKDNYYVLETSSNLNENPKIEQFSFENSKELYSFYKKFFDEVMLL